MIAWLLLLSVCLCAVQLLWLALAYWMLRILKKAGFLSQGAMVLRMSVNAKLNMVR